MHLFYVQIAKIRLALTSKTLCLAMSQLNGPLKVSVSSSMKLLLCLVVEDSL